MRRQWPVLRTIVSEETTAVDGVWTATRRSGSRKPGSDGQGTNGEAPKGEPSCFFARLRKQTCQTSVDLLDHKRRRLFLHRSGSRFFINIQAKLAVSQAGLLGLLLGLPQNGRLFSRLSEPSSDSRYTQNETTILRDDCSARPVRRTQPQTAHALTNLLSIFSRDMLLSPCPPAKISYRGHHNWRWFTDRITRRVQRNFCRLARRDN